MEFIKLTLPNGKPVHIRASGILSFTEATGVGSANANSLVWLGGLDDVDYGVLETVEEILGMLEGREGSKIAVLKEQFAVEKRRVNALKVSELSEEEYKWRDQQVNKAKRRMAELHHVRATALDEAIEHVRRTKEARLWPAAEHALNNIMTNLRKLRNEIPIKTKNRDPETGEGESDG